MFCFFNVSTHFNFLFGAVQVQLILSSDHICTVWALSVFVYVYVCVVAGGGYE